jgi:hypothetical protein
MGLREDFLVGEWSISSESALLQHQMLKASIAGYLRDRYSTNENQVTKEEMLELDQNFMVSYEDW